jgi:hypothetical protein
VKLTCFIGLAGETLTLKLNKYIAKQEEIIVEPLALK